jgi:hypothetical protein
MVLQNLEVDGMVVEASNWLFTLVICFENIGRWHTSGVPDFASVSSLLVIPEPC